jgi:hypothetical protein
MLAHGKQAELSVADLYVPFGHPKHKSPKKPGPQGDAVTVPAWPFSETVAFAFSG